MTERKIRLALIARELNCSIATVEDREKAIRKIFLYLTIGDNTKKSNVVEYSFVWAINLIVSAKMLAELESISSYLEGDLSKLVSDEIKLTDEDIRVCSIINEIPSKLNIDKNENEIYELIVAIAYVVEHMELLKTASINKVKDLRPNFTKKQIEAAYLLYISIE